MHGRIGCGEISCNFRVTLPSYSGYIVSLAAPQRQDTNPANTAGTAGNWRIVCSKETNRTFQGKTHRQAENVNVVMDWDKLRIFHLVAEAGSFTHAGELMNISQSAVSRQVSALERKLKVALFHRHARGLILTEQGELLYRTTQEVFTKLANAEILLSDSKDRPSGELRVTTTRGLGTGWLTPRLAEFINLYPDIHLTLLLMDDELDLTMREADVAIRFNEPTQNDLVRRRMFTAHYHGYASTEYIKKYGNPRNFADLGNHRVLTYGGAPTVLKQINTLEYLSHNGHAGREPVLRINSVYAVKEAVLAGIGVAVLPDYVARDEAELVEVLASADMPVLDTYFVYPEEMKNSKRVQVFRDFLIGKSREWSF
jgi:DNA-binding transcriptional LysR family regulator